jgi:hypothetical protein
LQILSFAFGCHFILIVGFSLFIKKNEKLIKTLLCQFAHKSKQFLHSNKELNKIEKKIREKIKK